MFGGHVHSPRTKAKVSSTPLLRVNLENPDHSSPSAESPSRHYLKNEKENVWGACALTMNKSKSPLLRVNVENPVHSSATVESQSPSELYLRNEKENILVACALT